MNPPPIASARRRRLVFGLGAGAGVGAGVWLALRQQAPALDPTVTALWASSFDRPEGGTLAMQSLRGKPLLINFWATWCAPCVRELPEIDRFHRDFQSKGWQVVGLAVDGPTPVREFLGRLKLGFPIGLAGFEGSELSRQLGNEQGGLPFTVAFDASGRPVQRKLGETCYEDLAAWARELG
ncbi:MULTISPECIES: TlpA disulfide reductase family protein [unclassified Methylibium]|uniref:TlpA disulfide reductase family protein n=1 Tax=unclassified Methylibium TaxID=2633235 RepID=UPI0003F406DE|nr:MULTISPECIES: TlpA disulfide reductase family protein [unclassified Methylibium]EWS56015.1 Thiol-disulfide oxidoreductase ResA [Methylibium sp. T29]EWS60361.1 Thiol-disulfide oxidoreductase ResA [Methylibium sp. T29-B]